MGLEKEPHGQEKGRPPFMVGTLLCPSFTYPNLIVLQQLAMLQIISKSSDL